MRESDLVPLSSVYVRALAHEPTESWTEEAALKLLANWYARQPDLAYVAEIDEKPIAAFVVAVRPWWDGNHLVDGELFVDPEFSKMGLAGRLIRQVLQVASEKYTPVFWETYTFRDSAFPLTWYRQLGFNDIHEWLMIRADVKTVLDNLNAKFGRAYRYSIAQ